MSGTKSVEVFSKDKILHFDATGSVAEKVEEIDDDRILDDELGDLVDEVLGIKSHDPPSVDVEAAEREKAGPDSIRVEMPASGDLSLLSYKPKGFNSQTNSQPFECHYENGRIWFTVTVGDDEEEAREKIERRKSTLKENVPEVAEYFERKTESDRREARREIEERRKFLEGQKDATDELLDNE